MKELCNKLMKLNPDLPFGTDYSTIALALFLQEEGFSDGKAYSIVEYAHYLYHFYSDIRSAKEKHYYKIINEIWHYQTRDIYEYAKSVLEHIEKNIGLIFVCNTSFYLVGCPHDIDKYNKVIQGVIQALVVKFVGNEYKFYNSQIGEEEIANQKVFGNDTRVFYRALETINYCFISDETDLSKLSAVELSQKDYFDDSNYLILSKEYADAFIDGSLHIKRNGYPYLNGIRLYQHLDIESLKKIRNNLENI